MSSLRARIRKIETGLDVARLTAAQVRLLDISRLSREQVQSLDVSQLTNEQLFQLDFKSLTDAQLEVVIKGLDEKYPETQAVIHSLSNEELTAVKEWRMCLWYPGYTGE